MKKVITYGTYDLLHYGHIRLLERAKELGDYLIVGVTSEDFDRRRGKINVEQSLMERIKAVKETGLADEIIIEEYEGQKIDDIINYGVDVFTVGSDWEGKFDYLKEYCEVVYLDRTKGISSTELRSKKKPINMGAIGLFDLIDKYVNEVKFVNGLEITNIISSEPIDKKYLKENNIKLENDYNSMLDNVEAVYIATNPDKHYELIKKALEKNVHVLYESPLALNKKDCEELIKLANEKKIILMEAIKTIYSQSYNRLILLAKSGVIGDIVSVDSTCTSLSQIEKYGEKGIINYQNTMCAWAPTAILPIFQLLGTKYEKNNIFTMYNNYDKNFDLFTKIDFKYKNAVASIKIGKGVKSDSNLVISGTKGYIYVPAPWWKTDYFEIRFENFNENKRYFYKLDGEGIRFELVKFNKSITKGIPTSGISKEITLSIVSLIEDFNKKKNLDIIERD